MSDFGDIVGNGGGGAAGDFGGGAAGDFGGMGGFGNIPVAASSGPAPDEAAAVTATEQFIDGVVWGDHNAVWALIGSAGRDEVLEVATKRGMDEGQAERLRTNTGSPAETNEFLQDLVNGLRAELAGNDLDSITYQLDAEHTGPGRVAVKMFVPLHPLLGGTLPIGTVFLAAEGDAWKVERLIPLSSK